MSPSSHRRLLQEQMQQATIKRRLAQAAQRRAVGNPFAGMQSFVRDLLAGVAVEVEAERSAPAPQADGPVRH
jgi:hypothetical protein